MGIMAICCLLCLFFLITWLHLWLSARTFCAIDLLGLDWVLIYCQETNWSPRYRICLLSFAILLGLDLYPGSCWRWCSMASGARVGKIYPLDEADVSCLDLFIMLLCLFCHSRLIIILWAWSFGHLVIWSSARQGRIITGKTTEQVSRFKLVRCRPPVDWSKWCCFGDRWPGALSVWFYWCNQLTATSTKWCSLCADLCSDMHPLSWFKAHSQIWKEFAKNNFKDWKHTSSGSLLTR